MRCFPAWNRSCFLVEHQEVSVGLDLKYMKEPLHGSFAFCQCRQLKSSTNVTVSPPRYLMKTLNSVDFGTDPLGAPLVAGDLSGMTRQFSVPLSTCFLAYTL